MKSAGARSWTWTTAVTSGKTLLASPRTWVYAALSATLLLSGIDLEVAWDLVLPPFKPQRLRGVAIASAALTVVLGVWLKRQFDDGRGRRRFVLPAAVGFALVQVSRVDAHEVSTTPPSAFQNIGDFVLSWLAFLGAVGFGMAVCAWVLVLVHYVRLAERSEAADGPQLVGAAIASGLLGFGTLFSLMHLVLVIDRAWLRPDVTRQAVLWCIWGVAWLGALIVIVATVRSRARQRRWLARVKKGRDSEYEILPLSEHPEWAKAPPYLTARSYSGVLVYEPEDESEARELLGRVE